MSVAVIDRDEIIINRGFGHRTLNPEASAAGATLYAVGSVTKPITALTTLLLDERDQIDIQYSISEYVPYFEEVHEEPISVHQLLSHTLGMPIDDLAFHSSELDD